MPEYKRGKKKRVTLELESVDIIPQLEYSACTAVARVEGEGALVAKVTKAVVRTQVGFLPTMFFMSWSFHNFLAGGACPTKTRVCRLENSQSVEHARDPGDFEEGGGGEDSIFEFSR